MRFRRLSLRKRVGAVTALALVAIGTAAGTSNATTGHGFAAARGASTSAPVSWTVDLSRGGSSAVNVRYTAGALRVRSQDFSPAGERPDQGYGSQVYPAHAVGHPVNRVRVALKASTPAATRVAIDVRGMDGTGAWTEWRTVDASGTAVLPRVVDTVQARLDLFSHAAAVKVRSLKLTADTTPVAVTGAATAGTVRPAAAESYQVYATREGLVGGTTANGHVIQTNDHFVALPSGRALSPNGTSTYSVTVCGPARCETAPVWDVGPWNTTDDYWNPAGTRQSWGDLAQGMPEAQAAYQTGYNGGHDQFGRAVSNPAGIDLADGTFYNVGLNDNGWVTVTYNWTSGGGGATTTNFPTWGTDVNIHSGADTTSGVVAQLAGPTTVAVQCQEHGQNITYDGITNDAWSYLPAYGGFISNIFINVPDAWLPGVPNC
jgi:hypothetical protein